MGVINFNMKNVQFGGDSSFIRELNNGEGMQSASMMDELREISKSWSTRNRSLQMQPKVLQMQLRKMIRLGLRNGQECWRQAQHRALLAQWQVLR